MQKKFLEFSPPISDICLYHHFSAQLNLPFSELNITPSVRPNLGIFKNFWNWISIFRQSSWVKKTQFELNLTSFKWALPRSALTGLPRLGWEYIVAATVFFFSYFPKIIAYVVCDDWTDYSFYIKYIHVCIFPNSAKYEGEKSSFTKPQRHFRDLSWLEEIYMQSWENLAALTLMNWSSWYWCCLA